ncbi:phosphocarrier protein HPr [uncultured Planococcus sp.]|uniref:phosphocarrier protein HPr n=1 Tax=Planococcus donghaensis TaxID=414778 RepID=UPI0026035C04|nr:phosphocarrier protein HPr [uncultured Planococcus sp.]
MVEKQFTLTDQAGIHARPAAILVNLASKFESEVNIVHREKKVNLKSILGVMSLGIAYGTEFKVNIEGSDEEDAIKEIEKIMHKEGLAE